VFIIIHLKDEINVQRTKEKGERKMEKVVFVKGVRHQASGDRHCQPRLSLRFEA
jgi:hypothetical protein